MRNKNLLSIQCMMVIANVCSVVDTSWAQTAIEENFDRDNISAWVGTTSHFIINPAQQLQLSNTAAGSSFLTTPFAPARNEDQSAYAGVIEWYLYVRFAFAGSSRNYGRIYLLSDHEDLTQTASAFYLQLGEAGSNDAIELFHLSNGITTSVCRGADGTLASSFAIRLKITRTDAGLWTVAIDYTGGSNFEDVATGVDSTFVDTKAFGIQCVYTIGNATRFYFDDIYVGPPKISPPAPPAPQVGDIVMNEFFPDPSPSVGLPAQEFVELYNKSDHVINLKDWLLADATNAANLPDATIEPGAYAILAPTAAITAYSDFGHAVGVVGFPSLNNNGDEIKLFTPGGLLMDSLTYELSWYQEVAKANGGFSIERLHHDSSSVNPLNWYASQSPTGGTPGAVNSVFGRNPDSKKPTVQSTLFLNDSTLQIMFSEPMQVGTLQNVSNYRLSGPGTVTVIPRDDTSLVLQFSNMDNGAEYALNMSGVTDVAGNEIDLFEIAFLFFVPHPVHAKDVLITEIMSDPTPVVQIPEAEYLELFNRSNHPINLEGWTLEDPVSRATLSTYILHPSSYVLLTSNANVSKFAHISNILGVASFPSLGNMSDRIVLRTTDNVQIDSISYTNSWYRNVEKADGGWSLELIDQNNLCAAEDNWAAAEDDRGGSPGVINSINGEKPDITPAELTRAFTLSEQLIELVFNERMDEETLRATFSLTPGAFHVTPMFKNSGQREIMLTTEEPVQFRIQYQLTVAGARDCPGNYSEPQTISLMMPEPAVVGDVLINEILFNPRPNAFDFVELMNASSKFIHLHGWKIGNRTTAEVMIGQDVILLPQQHVVVTPSRVSLESNYPAAINKMVIEMRLPSFPDDVGYLELLEPSGITVDAFDYSSKMHASMIRDSEGVSLERVSVRSPTNDWNNWHSAAGAIGYATPGFQNSSTMPDFTTSIVGIEVIPPVIRSQSSTPFAQIHYRLDRVGMVANVSVIDVEGRPVKELATNVTLGSEGFFRWDGDDSLGRRAPVGYYMVWFQAFDLDGTVITRRHRVVVGF